MMSRRRGRSYTRAQVREPSSRPTALLPRTVAALTSYACVLSFALLGIPFNANAETNATLQTDLREMAKRYAVEELDWHPAQIVAAERPHLHGSLSWSNTSHGSLRNAKRLPDRGPHHHVLEKHRARPTHWGTHELVDGILRAAAAVDARFPGSSVGVGNLSYKEGGDIPWSVSHNTGRDADIAFFFVDGKKRPVRVPDLVHIESDGLTARGVPNLYLDVPRSWAFVQAMVEDQDMRLQWIFVSDPIRTRLLEYAAEEQVDEAVIAAAASVLRQPANAAPHDDHFHLRVHCALDDRLDGCVEWGPRRAHIFYDDEAMERRVLTLLAALHGPDEKLAVESFAYLEQLEPREVASHISGAVLDVPEFFRTPMIRLATVLGGADVAHDFLGLLYAPITNEQKHLVLRALGGFALPSTASDLVAFAKDDDAPDELRLAAVYALRANMTPAALLLLIESLDSCGPELAEAIDEVLQRLTLAKPDASDSLAASWRRWLAAIETPESDEAWDELRGEWMERGLRDAGFDIGTEDEPNFSELIRALSDPQEQLAWNADRLLVRWTGIYSSAHRFNLREKTRFWRRQTRRLTIASRD